VQQIPATSLTKIAFKVVRNDSLVNQGLCSTSEASQGRAGQSMASGVRVSKTAEKRRGEGKKELPIVRSCLKGRVRLGRGMQLGPGEKQSKKPCLESGNRNVSLKKGSTRRGAGKRGKGPKKVTCEREKKLCDQHAPGRAPQERTTQPFKKTPAKPRKECAGTGAAP